MKQTSLYKGAFSTDKIRDITIKQLIHVVRNSEQLKNQTIKYRELKKHSEYEAKQLKNSMFAFAYAGVFENGRKLDDLKIPSGLMVMDFDQNKELPFIRKVADISIWMESLKQYITELPETVCAFISPSGGLKWAVQTDVIESSNLAYATAYKVLMERYEKQFTSHFNINIKLDGQCSNINRLCYISYDNTAYLNEESELVELAEEIEPVLQAKKDKLKKMIALADKQRKELEVKGYELCPTRQQALKQEAISKYNLNHNSKGQRHQGVFILGMDLFKCGLGTNDVIKVLKSLNKWTSELSPENKAIDILQRYVSDGRPLNRKAYKLTPRGIF